MRSLRRTFSVPFSVLTAALVGLVPAAFGQAPAPGVPLVAPGQRVRVEALTPGAPWVEGLVLGIRPDSLAVRRDGATDTTWLEVSSLGRFQVSLGRHSNAGRGALVGLGIGAGIGVALGLAALSAGSPSCAPASLYCGIASELQPGPEAIPILAAFIGGIGAGIGALIGQASSTDRWADVAGAPVHLNIAPGAHQVRVGVTLRF